MVSIIRKLFISIFGIVVFVGLGYSAPNTTISGITSFNPQTTISSSDMNGNFNTISNAYNTHSHTDISQLGTITSGVWNGTAVSTQYGGTGKDFSGVASGSIIYFDGVGSMTTLAPGSPGQVPAIKAGGQALEYISQSAGAKHQITRGFEASGSSLKTQVTINAGTLYHGTTYVNVATNSTLDVTTAGDYSSGTVVSYGTAGWNYIGVSSTASQTSKGVFLLGDAPPQYSDTDGNVDGIKLYTKVGATYYRIIGAVRQNNSNQIGMGFCQRNRKIVYNSVFNNDSLKVVSGVVSNGVYTAFSNSAVIPSISSMGSFLTNVASPITIRPTGVEGGIQEGGSANGVIFSDIPTDSSQSCDFKSDASSITLWVKDFTLDIR